MSTKKRFNALSNDEKFEILKPILREFITSFPPESVEDEQENIGGILLSIGAIKLANPQINLMDKGFEMDKGVVGEIFHKKNKEDMLKALFS